MAHVSPVGIWELRIGPSRRGRAAPGVSPLVTPGRYLIHRMLSAWVPFVFRTRTPYSYTYSCSTRHAVFVYEYVYEYVYVYEYEYVYVYVIRGT